MERVFGSWLSATESVSAIIFCNLIAKVEKYLLFLFLIEEDPVFSLYFINSQIRVITISSLLLMNI